MKNWNKYPLFLILLVSGLLITGAGYAGEHTIYASYSKQDGWMTPGLSLVFQGWKDGVYPWELFTRETSPAMAGAQNEGEEETAFAEETVQESIPAAEEAADAGGETTVSDNSQKQADGVSENSAAPEVLDGSSMVSANTAQPKYDKFGQLIQGEAPEQQTQQIPMQIPGTDSVSGNQGTEVSGGQETAESQQIEAGEETAQDGLAEEENKTYAFTQVDESYFDDALFIGDSRTVGLDEYAGFDDKVTFYAATSLTIYNVFDSPKKVAQLEDGTKVTIEEALSQKQFGKIYIMLGINELGRGTTESFFTVYANAVNRIRQLQPDAIIYVQGIMRVSGEKSRTDKIFNNENINARNAALAAMANNQDIFYLEVNDAVSDANGDLVTEYTFDQIHLKAKYYQLWKNYLLGHAVVRD